MCTYTSFISKLSDKNDPFELSEYRKPLERNHKTFELCLKTLSKLLCVKSEETPLDNKNSRLICEYFNGELPVRLNNAVIGIEEKKVEGVLIEVTRLLAINTSLGLQPIISNLRFEITNKEFYSRAVVLLLNISIEAHKRYGSSFGSETNLDFNESNWMSFESAQEWKSDVLSNNLTYTLCKLALAWCVFGTDEAGLFGSYGDLPGCVLSLFPYELWIYVLGAFPVLCFENSCLFSIKALSSYVEVMAEKCDQLIQNLISCHNFNIYLYDQIDNFNENTEQTLHIIVMSNWIDYLYKHVKNKIVMCNNADRTQCTIITNWLSKLLNNKLILTIIYAVYKYNCHLCNNTIVKFASVNDNIVFLQHIIFKSDIGVKIRLELLRKLDISEMSKDVLSVTSIINYLIKGFKSEEMVEYYRVLKIYLKQYTKIKYNRPLINNLLEVILEYLMNGCYEKMEFPPEVFRSEVRRSDIRERKLIGERMEILIKRNMLVKIVEIIGYKNYEEKLVTSIERGYEVIKKQKCGAKDLAVLEFVMFLIYALKWQKRYEDIYTFNINNGYVLFYRYLDKTKNYVTENVDFECESVNLEDEYHNYLTYYYTNRILEHSNKESMYYLNTIVSSREGGEGIKLYHNRKMLTYVLESFISKHIEVLLKNVKQLFHESNNSIKTMKAYLKYASLYMRVYECLHDTNATDRVNRRNHTVDLIVTRYLKLYKKVLLRSIGILVKNPEHSLKYPEVLRVPFVFDRVQLFKILEFSNNVTENFVTILLDNFKYLGNEYVKPVVELIVRLSERLTSQLNWNESHVGVFEKLLILIGQVMKSSKYMDELMSNKEGVISLKKVLVVGNSIPIEETGYKVSISRLNLEVIDVLLSLSDERRKRRHEESTLRSEDFAIKELERLLTSPCGKFEITEQKKEKKLALGILSVIDVMIYQSLSQIFKGKNEKSKEKNRKKNSNKDKSKVEMKDEEKEKEKESNVVSNGKKRVKSDNVNYTWEWNESYIKDDEKELFEDQTIYWKLIGPECMYSLKFIAKIYLGFNMLPQTKLLLITEYFFIYASVKSNMETREIRNRILTENNRVKPESAMFIYEFYKTIEKKSYT